MPDPAFMSTLPRDAARRMRESIERDGFAIVSAVIDQPTIDRLIAALEAHVSAYAAESAVRRGRSYAMRNLLSIDAVRQLAGSAAMREMIAPILGDAPFCVRGILFDKIDQANWHVGWHQDRAIAVRERIDDAPGFGPWSVKAGVVHVEPPVELLERMLTVRLHLDDCDESNGPLRVLPGSHRLGRLTPAQLHDVIAPAPDATGGAARSVTCTCPAGGALVMRPLLLHASGPARETRTAAHRRVVHLEYAAEPLPGRLAWHAAVAGG